MLGEIRSIVAATDLSPAADRTLAAAAQIARRAGARMHVVHVVEPSPGRTLRMLDSGREGSGGAPLPGSGASAMELEAQLARTLRDGEPFVPALVPGHSPAQAIGGHATEVEADLIVMGAPGEDNTVGGILGTIADRVLRSADAAVLVVLDERMMRASRVMVAMDRSEPSAGVVGVALEWAALYGGRPAAGSPVRVDVVHVLSGSSTGLQRPEGITDARRGHAPAAGWQAPPGVELRELVLQGEETAATLVEYAREAAPDLLVAGSRGRGGIMRALLGSTSSAVASRAPCSVLLLPPRVWLGAA